MVLSCKASNVVYPPVHAGIYYGHPAHSSKMPLRGDYLKGNYTQKIESAKTSACGGLITQAIALPVHYTLNLHAITEKGAPREIELVPPAHPNTKYPGRCPLVFCRKSKKFCREGGGVGAGGVES